MSSLKFEWDEDKNRLNQQKHGINFEEAKTVFYDDFAVQFWDEVNSETEERFLLLGRSSLMRLLLVVHCYREQDSVIRVISARKATSKEKRFYQR